MNLFKKKEKEIDYSKYTKAINIITAKEANEFIKNYEQIQKPIIQEIDEKLTNKMFGEIMIRINEGLLQGFVRYESIDKIPDKLIDKLKKIGYEIIVELPFFHDRNNYYGMYVIWNVKLFEEITNQKKIQIK